MNKLTKDEYKELMNKVGQIAKFYVQQIPGVKYNLDFYESFENVNKNNSISITDKNYDYSTPLRIINRDNETICLIKNIDDKDTYEDKFTYYLTVDFNKKIKMYIDYNQIISNEYNGEEIEFEVLESYQRKECGDMYGSGKVISGEEYGYKGKVSSNGYNCTLEYGKYNYNSLTVLLPEETYEYNQPIPELENLDKEVLTFKIPNGIYNASFLAVEEENKKELKGRQRVR